MGRKQASHTQGCPPNPGEWPRPTADSRVCGTTWVPWLKVLSRPFTPMEISVLDLNLHEILERGTLGFGDEGGFERNASLHYMAELRMPEAIGKCRNTRPTLVAWKQLPGELGPRPLTSFRRALLFLGCRWIRVSILDLELFPKVLF